MRSTRRAGGDASPRADPAAAGVQARLDRYDDVVHALLPPQPYWYLGILARHPSRRGLGLARRLTRLVLEHRGDGDDDGVPAVLETTNSLNVAAYERAGWTVYATSDELQPAMRIYVMRHGRGGGQPAPALAVENVEGGVGVARAEGASPSARQDGCCVM